jgi:hypothetical protein
MSDYPEIAARFARDTASHRMIVLHEDGLYRHLRFTANPRGYGEYWFDLITWPGCLTIRGDYGDAYTFSREPDMFEFFRSQRRGINPHYWSQKLDGHRQSATEYSEDVFRQIVCELFVDAVRYGNAPRGLGKAVRTEILDQDLHDEGEARKLLESFEYGGGYRAECATCKAGAEVSSYTGGFNWEFSHKRATSNSHSTETRRVEGFAFYDTWEFSFQEYERDFLWACHAIVWGIARYDRVRKYGLQALAAPKPREAGQAPAPQHYDKVPDPADGCHWCACGNRWPCKDAGEADQ